MPKKKNSDVLDEHKATALCVCVCVWFRFMGWEQCGAAALSSHQAGVQEINVYYVGKKEIKSQLDP